MKISRKAIVSLILTVLSVLLTAFCICGTAAGQGKERQRIEEKYYRSMEQEYKQELCELLALEGYQNSGVVLNYVTEGNGVRYYTVTIHHKRIKKLDEESRRELISRCREISFPMPDCLFFHQFLETDL